MLCVQTSSGVMGANSDRRLHQQQLLLQPQVSHENLGDMLKQTLEKMSERITYEASVPTTCSVASRSAGPQLAGSIKARTAA